MAKDDSRAAEFIGRVVSDPKNPPETRLLSGWLGDAAEEGCRRLYTDAELSAYVDIPEEAILYSEPIRDVQPSGGVFVWVKRDAQLKQGGSAASRAASYLQGQVQRDFASGGGAAGGAGGAGAAQGAGSLEKYGYRCVTEVPCAEPTGFTGKCTQQPEVGGAWPCLTAIPICAEPTGITGKCTPLPWPNPTRYVGCTFLHCPTFDLTCIPQICNIVASGLPGCGAADPFAGGGERAARGTGATGETEGAGTEEKPAAPETSLPGCGYTQVWGVCETHLLGCGFTKEWGHQCPTQLLGCGQTKDCPTAIPGCGWSKNPICTDLPGCGFTKQWGVCQQTPQGGGARGFAAAAGPVAGAPFTADPQNVQCNPSIVDACPTRLQCDTKPPTTFCTQLFDSCPPTTIPGCSTTKAGECQETICGPACQTPQPGCTQLNCTHLGPGCPTDPVLDCTFGCTHFAQGCPSNVNLCINTNQPQCFVQDVGARAQAFAAAGPGGPIGPTGFQGCTQGGPQCLTIPDGDCTFFGNCPSPVHAQCPTCGQPQCTVTSPACPPTPATVCTQGGPQCQTQFCQQQRAAQQAAAAAGPAAGGAGLQITVPWLCAPTPATRCFICPPRQTLQPWQCGAPTPATQCFICPPLTRSFRQCGGPSVFDACPTRLCGVGQ